MLPLANGGGGVIWGHYRQHTTPHIGMTTTTFTVWKLLTTRLSRVLKTSVLNLSIKKLFFYRTANDFNTKNNYFGLYIKKRKWLVVPGCRLTWWFNCVPHTSMYTEAWIQTHTFHIHKSSVHWLFSCASYPSIPKN